MYSVMSEVTVVSLKLYAASESVTVPPEPVVPIYQPANVAPVFVGSSGSVAYLPETTVCASNALLPSSFLNVIV